jgi:mannitol/fructose-specific phosphotransferase system IIA component (Ntr-type)
MLDKLKELFKEGLEYTHTAGILQQVANIANMIHVQYMKDGVSKNEAIDHICAMLQKHKVVPAQEGQDASK